MSQQHPEGLTVHGMASALQLARVDDAAGVSADSCLSGGGSMGALVRAYDWTSNPLGPVSAWPQSLRTAVSIMLASRFPMLVLWGEGYIQLYNDAFRPVLGATKHPAALGQRACDCWPEIWEGTLRPMFGQVMAGGDPIWSEDLLFLLDRNGYLEETYFTFSYSAIRDESGRPGGVLVTCIETTERVLSEHRLQTLRDLSANALSASSAEDTCRVAADTLAQHPGIPFALIYLSVPERAVAELVCTTRVPLTHAAAAPRLALEAEAAGAAAARAWPLFEVQRSRQPLLLTDLASRFGPLPGGRWPEPPREALILPLTARGQQELAGFLIAGIDQRRALDPHYQDFLELVAAHVATAIANARAHQEERRRAEALAELDRSKTAFFSNVSHEFRTPLALMLGPLQEVLSHAGLASSARESLEVARRNALRLLKLVNSLLDFARIEAGRVQARFEPVDLCATTLHLASAFHSAIERAGLALELDCQPIGEPVYVDPDLWEKIVLNLLSNALKFTERGSIRVSLRREGDRALLMVQDTGVGIPERELPRIFERFHRVEGTQGRTHEGSGIGLALVHELVHLHQGTIEVRSRVGDGSAFLVRLPLGTRHLPSGQLRAASAPPPTAIGSEAFVQEALRWLPESTKPDSVTACATAGAALGPIDRRFAATFGARILLADDNADMRSYLCTLLQPYYQVETAADGEQALAAIRQHPPALVIADVMMPRRDGLSLLQRLRADAQLRAVPLILLSARAGEEARVEGLDAGADDYIVKPFSARELLARVGSLLESARIRREQLEELQRLDRQKNDFLAMLAHELRNPLAPICSASELLSRAVREPPPVLESVAVIRRQSAQLSRLVDDLLDVSRITLGRVELKLMTVELAAVIRQAVETVQPLLQARRHQLTLQLSERPLWLQGDFVRLVQCVTNLLTNACKYTPAGGEIHLTVTAKQALAAIEVRDNGMGISSELLPRVFDLFVQGDRTLDRAEGGLGIGLPVVKKLIEMHNGSVRAHSDGVGRGASFQIVLPVLAAAPETPVPPQPSAPEPTRIFIIDDNADGADSLAMLLELEGHATRAVHTPREALAQIESFRPHIVLLDIGLPQMDGYELLKRLRPLPSLAGVRFIAMTGYGHKDDRARTQAEGFDHHLVKPVSVQALSEVLGSAAAAS